MTNFFIVFFTILTFGVGYLTFNDIGLQDTNFSDNSVRSGSGGTSGYRHGK
ncbi:MAG: hypothetical protein U9P71_00460 [Campylobacterota bacterium]|nr:hypothetical protein [Campylobacterota bacterium]